LVDVVSAPESQERQERVTDADRQAYAERAQDAAIERVLARESAPELVNGCNLEACLTYAQERVSALEERVERWRSHAQDLEREVNANLEELRTLRAELQR
jgi:predicted RNase H-like nuclease (RuvC/YqgF family)